MERIEIAQCEIESAALGNRRTVWVQTPTKSATGVLVFLDAEYYFAHMRAARVVRQLQDERAIPPLLAAYVSCIDYDVRWPESFCNPDFATFLARELLPCLVDEFRVPSAENNALAGLSLTGLSAAHAALEFPDDFPRVLCQSGSFWWNDGWLADNLPASPSKLAVRITVGNKETDEDVDHGKGLIQKESQLASNLKMRDALIERGHRVSYHEFDGGHETACWRDDLAESLAALFEL